MQQHQQISQQQPYLIPQQPMQQINLPLKQPHWFDHMCEVITTQQSRHEAGSLDTPPMLTPGNYFQWVSRFLRFIELKKPRGRYMKKVILEGPFQMSTTIIQGDATTIPPRPEIVVTVPESQLTAEQLLHHEADEYAMIYILKGIPNPIFRSVDAQKTAKAMWEHVHLLIECTKLNQEDMESKLYMEYTMFMIEPGESLESYYHRFTNIINDQDKHNITLPKIVVNTKLLALLVLIGKSLSRLFFKQKIFTMHHMVCCMTILSIISLKLTKIELFVDYIQPLHRQTH